MDITGGPDFSVEEALEVRDLGGGWGRYLLSVEDVVQPSEEILGIEWDGGPGGEDGVGLVVGREEVFGAMGEVEQLEVLGWLWGPERTEWIWRVRHRLTLVEEYTGGRAS